MLCRSRARRARRIVSIPTRKNKGTHEELKRKQPACMPARHAPKNAPARPVVRVTMLGAIFCQIGSAGLGMPHSASTRRMQSVEASVFRFFRGCNAGRIQPVDATH